MDATAPVSNIDSGGFNTLGSVADLQTLQAYLAQQARI
jgi:hypothetical protein